MEKGDGAGQRRRRLAHRAGRRVLLFGTWFLDNFIEYTYTYTHWHVYAYRYQNNMLQTQFGDAMCHGSGVRPMEGGNRLSTIDSATTA